MDDQNTVTIKVILDTEEAEAAIERLREKLSSLANLEKRDELVLSPEKIIEHTALEFMRPQDE